MQRDDHPGATVGPDEEAIPKAIKIALEHHHAGRLAQAEAIYRQILHVAPDHPEAMHLLGMVAFQVGQDAVAADLIGRVIDRNASDPDYCRDFADVLRFQGKAEEAIAWYGKALALKADDPNVHLNMGNALRATGRLDDAAASYRQALAVKPDYPEAHNNLATALQAQGKLDEAIVSLRKASSLSPRSPDLQYNLANALRDHGELDEAAVCYRIALSLDPKHLIAHFNLARVLHHQGKLDEAIAGYRNVVAIEPNHAEARYYLGAAFHAQGRVDEAIASYRKALSARPGYPEAHNDLGNALNDSGRPHDAAACYREALRSRPGYAAAHNNLGNVLQILGKPHEALACYDSALSSHSDYAAAHNNRGNVLCELGRFDAALTSYRRALDLGDSAEFKANFAQCVGSLNFVEADAALRGLVTRAIAEPWARPADLARAGISLLKLDPRIGKCIERAALAWPARLPGPELYGPTGLAALAGDPLLRALLESTPVCDLALERLLTLARHALLDAAAGAADGDEPDDGALTFYCAVARQCFIDEFVFSCTDDELDRLESLQARLAAALRSAAPVPALWVIAAAAYAPLSALGPALALRERSWPAAVAALLAQQIDEPLAERHYRDAVPVLTPVGDRISRRVREQYEDNPYPRWIKAAPPRAVASVDTYLRRHYPFAPFAPLGKAGDVDILIAGCGTGQHSIETAQQYPAARVLALDLSLSSLAYALRKSHEIGVRNVEYAQGDILELASLGRTFDVIEAVGVLHHLAEPMAGWRQLLALLRPGGLMQVGLYSERARRGVVAARQFIAAEGYGSSAADIRRCRQALIAAQARGHPGQLTSLRDFYATSECRDLLFHVQEHRFTLPQVKEALAFLGLRFIGFVLPPRVTDAYSERFPEDKARTDLDRWNEFEAEFPGTFIGMYTFWVQDPGRS